VPAPKYPRPKILIIDAPEVADQLARAGYTAAKGTFGTPLILEREAGYRVLKRTMHLPNHTEQKIVVVDLAGPQEREAKESDFKLPAHGVKALWAPTELGRVDPRLPVMRFEQSNFDRIYEHGGSLSCSRTRCCRFATCSLRGTTTVSTAMTATRWTRTTGTCSGSSTTCR
jgi:hypothetical protein